MANIFMKCSGCVGNMWPTTGTGVKEHVHLDPLEKKRQLKLKYRTRKTGRNAAAPTRTNPSKKGAKTIRPRRKAYGPF